MSQLIKNKKNFFVGFAKILIITVFTVYVIGSFEPYYQGTDSYLYGIISKNLSIGEYSISNYHLEETGRDEFVGGNWVKTVQDNAIPVGGIGLPIIATFFYIIGGNYGLFYLTPIFGILFLITGERVTTKLFGKYVGLLTLLFLFTNHLIFRNSLNLQTDVIFSLFFILGAYFLIKFLKDYQNYSIFLASSFFVISTLIRVNGIVTFPAEVAILGGVVIYKIIMKKKSVDFNRLSFKKATLSGILLITPWIIFLIFWFSFNDYYFDDPFTNYRLEARKFDPDIHGGSQVSSLLSIKYQDFENLKEFSQYLLPYQFPALNNQLDNQSDLVFGEKWLGIIFIVILAIILFTSLILKKNRKEILILAILALSVVWFLSSITTEGRAELKSLPARYMIPSFALTSMIFSLAIVNVLKSDFISEKIGKNFLKILKIFIICILSIFFIFAFIFFPPTQGYLDKEIKFNNPVLFAEKYPLDLEGLNEYSIVLARQSDYAIDYGVTPFNYVEKREISQKSMELLHELIRDGNGVFVFKEETNGRETEEISTMVNEYGFVLKDFSNTFCKIEINSHEDKILNSDLDCLRNGEIRLKDKN